MQQRRSARCSQHGVRLTDYPPAHILGIAVVQPAFVYDELQVLQPHERLQHQVYQTLMGSSVSNKMYVFKILNCLQLPTPTPIQALGLRKPRSFFLEEGQQERLARLIGPREEQPARLQAQPVPVPPLPFAVMCSLSHWPSFAAADLFRHGLFRGWSSAATPQIWDADEFPQPRF